MPELNPSMTAILTLEEFRSVENGNFGDSQSLKRKIAAITCVKDGNNLRLINVDEFLQQMGEDHNSATVYRFLGWFPVALNTDGIEIKYMRVDENWFLQTVSTDAVEGLKRL